MFSETDIIAKAWLTKEIVNLVLIDENLSVDKILLVGSYASGKATDYSDVDFVVQLKGGKMYPKDIWKSLKEIASKLDTTRVHVIFGTEEAVASLHKKHINEKKDYKFREISLQGVIHADSCGAGS